MMLLLLSLSKHTPDESKPLAQIAPKSPPRSAAVNIVFAARRTRDVKPLRLVIGEEEQFVLDDRSAHRPAIHVPAYLLL